MSLTMLPASLRQPVTPEVGRPARLVQYDEASDAEFAEATR